MFGRLLCAYVASIGISILLVIVTGCGSGSGAALSKPDTVAQQPGAALGSLPTPDVALARLGQAAGAPAYWSFGRQSEAGLSHNAQAQGDCVRFSPDWSGSPVNLNGLAYSIYRFNMTDYTGADEFTLDWLSAPAQPGQVWLGFSDWAHNRWQWSACPQNGVLELPQPPGLARYEHAGTLDMLVAVVVLGQGPGVLHRCGVQLAALADNWPMYQHDAQHTGRSLHIGPDTNALKWKFSDPWAPVRSLGSPAAGTAGQAYAGSSEYLYAFNADGSLAWQSPVAECGKYAPAIAADGTILVGSKIEGSSTTGELYALNPDGTVKWTYSTYPLNTPVLAADGSINFSSNGLCALNPDGTLKWNYTLPSVGFGSPACSPAGVVYAQGYHSGDNTSALYALNADGTLRWIYTSPDGMGISAIQPAVDSAGTVYTLSDSLIAINPDGTLKWQCAALVDYTLGSPVCADQTVYVLGHPAYYDEDFSLFAVDGVTGAVKWELAADDLVYSTPVLDRDGNVIYGEGVSTDYINSELRHHVHAVTPEGSPLWTAELRGAVLPQLASNSEGVVFCTTSYYPLNSNYVLYRVNALNAAGALMWANGSGTANVSGSAVVGNDGRVYAALDNGNAYALNPDGAISWLYASDGADYWGCPALLDDGTLYMPSIDDSFYAINEGGALKWQSALPQAVRTASPTVGPDGTVYIGDFGTGYSGNPNYCYDGVFFALKPDGTLKWSHMLQASFYSSPAIGLDGTIFVASLGGDLHAFDSDGNVKWESAQGTMQGTASIAIGADGTLYAGGPDKGFSAFNPDGTTRWTLDLGCAVDCAPALAWDGTIYVSGYDGVLRAVDPDGTLAWTYTAGDKISSSPMVDSAGRIYFASLDKSLYALNPDGTLLWTLATGGAIFASPTIGLDGTVYIGSTDGYLYAIGPGHD